MMCSTCAAICIYPRLCYCCGSCPSYEKLEEFKKRDADGDENRGGKPKAR